MYVGILHLSLRLADNHSLKGKRQVVKSLIARMHNEFSVAAAEVDDNDAWQSAGIGVCCVSNNALHAEQVLNSVVQFVERTRPDLDILDSESEVTRVM